MATVSIDGAGTAAETTGMAATSRWTEEAGTEDWSMIWQKGLADWEPQ
jgi:hypothetical protein